jgi:outer membrane protein assembly factor BamB
MYVNGSILPILILILLSCSDSKEMSPWRGPDRDGKFPQESLLKAWPEDGPTMLWSFEGLGAGHGSASIAGDRIFVLGMPDTMGVIYAFDMHGTLLWQKEYGLEWYTNYTGPRSTPTIVDDLLYFISGQGVVYCMEASSGTVMWSRDMFSEFGAQKIRWGIAESPLIDGDRIIITPGGMEHNVVALNRFNGETIWTGKGNSDPSAYCSPIMIQHNDTRLIVTMTAESILGIDAENGQTYWRVEQRQGNDIHANSPVYQDGMIFCASAAADSLNGHVMLKLSEDGRVAEVGWRNEDLRNLMGGIILHDGCTYSSAYRKKEWFCIDALKGNVKYVSNEVAGGALIFADGLFYHYGTDGQMSLMEADRSDSRVVSRFSIPLGTDQHWAHPTIHKGRMYVRHGNALMCYDIAAK